MKTQDPHVSESDTSRTLRLRVTHTTETIHIPFRVVDQVVLAEYEIPPPRKPKATK